MLSNRYLNVTNVALGIGKTLETLPFNEVETISWEL